MDKVRQEWRTVRFQYIKCGGSAIGGQSDSILLLKFQYIKCGGSAKIL